MEDDKSADEGLSGKKKKEERKKKKKLHIGGKRKTGRVFLSDHPSLAVMISLLLLFVLFIVNTFRAKLSDRLPALEHNVGFNCPQRVVCRQDSSASDSSAAKLLERRDNEAPLSVLTLLCLFSF